MLAMTRMGESERQRRRGRGGNTRTSRSGGGGIGSNDSDKGWDHDVSSNADSVAFFGHNPIVWMTEPSVLARTATMLLKWYPVGGLPKADIAIPSSR